ncbi:hypothetical protein M2T36_26600, partial [Escherichia coli]|uniref:hypothetical protein n=1 Tax=Escherichia coli TaxID=562 RepID=UPI00200FCF20
EEVVKKMWDMAYYYGYDGGNVLEPSVGTGHFLTYAPKSAIVFGFETNHYSARIAQILYPHAHIHAKAFETLFQCRWFEKACRVTGSSLAAPPLQRSSL